MININVVSHEQPVTDALCVLDHEAAVNDYFNVLRVALNRHLRNLVHGELV